MPTLRTKLRRDARDLQRCGLPDAANAAGRLDLPVIIDAIIVTADQNHAAASRRFLATGDATRTPAEKRTVRVLLAAGRHVARAITQRDAARPYLRLPALGDGDPPLPLAAAPNAAQLIALERVS